MIFGDRRPVPEILRCGIAGQYQIVKQEMVLETWLVMLYKVSFAHPAQECVNISCSNGQDTCDSVHNFVVKVCSQPIPGFNCWITGKHIQYFSVVLNCPSTGISDLRNAFIVIASQLASWMTQQNSCFWHLRDFKQTISLIVLNVLNFNWVLILAVGLRELN